MVAKEWDEAKGYYEQLAKQQPKSGEPYYRLAQIQTMNKDYPRPSPRMRGVVDGEEV
jgi:hypothetical protein